MGALVSARKEQVDRARRRWITFRVEKALDGTSARTDFDQLASSLKMLAGDELQVVEHMIGVYGAGLHTVAAIVARLLRGRSEYGELVLDDDRRNFAAEQDEEIADAALYEAFRKVRDRRRGLAPASVLTVGGPVQMTAAHALARVGRRLVVELPALTDRARGPR